MEEILKLDIPSYIKKLETLNNDEIKKIILSSEFLNASDSIIICTFNKTNNEIKDIFMSNNKLVSRLLKISTTQKSKFNIFDINIQRKIIEKTSAFLNLNEQEYFSILKSMNEKIYQEFIKKINEYVYNNDVNTNNNLIKNIKEIYINKNKEKIEKYLIKKFNITEERKLNNIALNFINRKTNIFELCRIETEKQLYIYNKYGLFINKNIAENVLEKEYGITNEILEKLKKEHIIRIINELKNKGDVDNSMLFITSIKLYSLFGLDNALKVINDKFTYTTESSINEAALFKFTSDRRAYRLSHPDEFYNYELIEKLKKSVQSNELNIVKKISSNSDTIYIKNLFKSLKENYTLYKNDNRLITYFNETIKKEILTREEKLKEIFIEDYIINNLKKRNPVSCEELFKLFGKYDLINTKFDQNNNVYMDENLKKFLLDNEKADRTNKALLRMVFNRQAGDYNNELINIINNYYKIQIIKKTSNLKAKNSMLDMLDIYKSFKYKLNYDELDIPLQTISKIMLSKKFRIVESEEEVLNSFKKTYRESRKKVRSTIPKVKGETKYKYRYKILDKNDKELLTCGIETDCCFKPGGLGNEFYNYALTSIYADVIGIWDLDNNFYICPIIRNGNGIYGNGIDPNNISKEKIPYIIDAIKKCYSDIIKKSSDEEKIEFCTLSNLHNYIKGGYNEIIIDKSPIIGKSFYCDILKNDIENYLIIGDYSKKEEYIPKITFENVRSKKYVYSKDQSENKVLIEQKINEIEYRSIDFKKCSDIEKQLMKENYNYINVDEYKYIVCNDDWYLALSDDLEIKSAVLPYDSRAKNEYLIELQKVKSIYQIITELEKETSKTK